MLWELGLRNIKYVLEWGEGFNETCEHPLRCSSSQQMNIIVYLFILITEIQHWLFPSAQSIFFTFQFFGEQFQTSDPNTKNSYTPNLLPDYLFCLLSIISFQMIYSSL